MHPVVMVASQPIDFSMADLRSALGMMRDRGDLPGCDTTFSSIYQDI